MRYSSMNRRERLRFWGMAILVVGLAAAVVIHFVAPPAVGPVVGYQSGDGGSQPITAFESKQYMRNLEMYGGKMGVMLFELATWFAGLWQGKALAKTVGFIAVLAAAVCFHLSGQEPEEPEDPRHAG